MNNYILFIYRFYRTYLLFLCTFVVALVVIRGYFRKKDVKVTALKNTCLVLGILIMTVLSSYFINRVPLGYNEINITPYCKQGQEVIIIKETVTDIPYYALKFSKNIWKQDKDYSWRVEGDFNSGEQCVLKIPHGMDRTITFKSGPNEGKVQITYYLNDINYNEEVDLYSDTEATIEYVIGSTRAKEFLLEYLIKIVLNVILIAIILKIALYIYDHIHVFGIIRKWGTNNRFGFLTFLLLYTHFIYNKPTVLAGWSSASYALTYKLGFGSRFFIGSILSLFYKNFLDGELAYNFCCICNLLIIILFSILVNKVVTKSQNSIAVIYLIGIYLCSPGSVASLWSIQNMGRLETYNYLLVLIGILVFLSRLDISAKYAVLAVITVCNMAIYQGYIFLYYPVIFIICVCDCLKYKDIKRWILFAGNVIVTIVAFGIFQFATFINFADSKELVAYLEQHTNLAIYEDALYYEYFAPVSTAFKDISQPMLLGTDLREKTFITIFLLAPIMFLVTYIIIRTVKKENMKVMLKKPYIYWLVGYVAFLPQFALNVDWWRWMAAMICYTFFAIISMYLTGEKDIRDIFGTLKGVIIKYPIGAATILIYLAMLDKFSGIAYSTQAYNLMTEVLRHIKNYL